jgi:SNF2 family DNA or RNA helicase
MNSTEHPTAQAIKMLSGMCDGARQVDDCGFNKFDAGYFRDKGIPALDYDLNREAKRLLKYHRQLPSELVEALKKAADDFMTQAQTPTIVKSPDKRYFSVIGVDRSNKDACKAAAELAVGKKCLLWCANGIDGWSVHRKFVKQLVESGSFQIDASIQPEEYEYVSAKGGPQFERAKKELADLGLSRELRHYQEQGVDFFVSALAEVGKGAILADEQGLGKTIQAITAALRFQEKVVVVCPASVRFNWASEVFMAVPYGTVCVYNDNTPLRHLARLYSGHAKRFELQPHKADVVIMSYEATRNMVQGNSDPITSQYDTMKMEVNKAYEPLFTDRILVVDEFHYAKNTGAKRTQATLAVCRASKRVIALTGTPVFNKPEDFWTLLCGTRRHLDVARSKKDYMTYYVKGERYKELNDILTNSGWFLRRVKKDHLTELPPKVRQDLILEMTPRQRAEYESLRQSLKSTVKHGGKDAPRNILALLTALQTKANECKVEPISEDIIARRDEGLLTVVQSTRVEPLKRIYDLCKAEGVKVELLIGGVSDSERKRITDDFNAGLIDAVLTTIAEGINLVGGDKMILLDFDWTHSKMSQREDRAHRIGQKQSLMVTRVIAASIDTHKRDVVANKKVVSDLIVDGGDPADSEDTNLGEVVRRLVDEE